MSQQYGQEPGYQPQQPYPPQPGYGYPPGPPQRRKKSNAGKILFAVLAGVLVLFGGCAVLISNIGGGKPTTTTAAEQEAGDQPTKSGQPKKKAETPGIGAVVKDGKFSFKVTKVEQRPRVGTDLIGKDAQGVFLLVHVTVKNVGDEAQGFTSAAQKLHADGKEFEADAGAAIYLKDSKSLYEKINPGNSVRGMVLFDIPKTVKPTTIELHDSMFSDGVKVALAGS